MNPEAARSLLNAEHDQLREQLAAVGRAEVEDRQAEDEIGDEADSAQSLEAQGIDDALAASLRDRLSVVERALRRIDDGTYGRSVRSGTPIPDARLEADPAAELTVAEAAEDQGPTR
ncbi:DnaK suppressor protein [Catenulispora sp. MAP12-49]|uniref:TraR/DksA family transcriptional regulator n=1 Tax=unclassified Catenulispora TaxID=414885 RepID=UPI003511F0BD